MVNLEFEIARFGLIVGVGGEYPSFSSTKTTRHVLKYLLVN